MVLRRWCPQSGFIRSCKLQELNQLDTIELMIKKTKLVIHDWEMKMGVKDEQRN